METMNDVTGGGGLDTSSVSQAPTEQSQPSPAEALTTAIQDERVPENIPYARFKEVNEQKKQLEAVAEKWKAYEGKEELIDTYDKFDQMLAGNEKLRNALTMAMQLAQQQSPQEPVQPPPNPAHQVIYENYMNEFSKFATENQIPDEIKPIAQALTEGILMRINPDPLNNYSMANMKQALESVKNLFEHIYKSKQASYIEQKRNDTMPATASRTGAAPTIGPKSFNTREERTSLLTNMLSARD